jgi:hypothetical protein
MTAIQLLMTATRRAARWHVHSQEVARRNAMVARTALTQRRAELNEVEAFLASHQRRHAARSRIPLQDRTA